MTDDDPVSACLLGRISPEVAIARLLLAGDTPEMLRARVAARRDTSVAWTELNRWTEQQASLQRLRHMLDAAAVDHRGAASPAEIARLFDRAVAISPEASVAFYSLGDPLRLQAATAEIIGWLRTCGLIPPQACVLDLGCGIGRMTGALAPHVALAVGTDVSRAMLREARRRCAGFTNVAFVATAGEGLGHFSAAAFHLILAVDCFPYLVQSGVAERHVAEARRTLRPDGRLVVCNLSYRQDPALDRDDAREWAQRYHYSLRETGTTPFRSWDGRVFVFQRAEPEPSG